MKKLLYLFLTVLIVGCSGEDGGNGNQLFMEKYDGVVWKENNPLENRNITFSNDISGIIFFNEGADEDDCSNFIFGEPFPFYGSEDEDGNGVITGYQTMTIQSELEDSMVLSWEIVQNNGTPTFTGSVTFTVSSGGGVLLVAYVGIDPANPLLYYPIAPDEFPCY